MCSPRKYPQPLKRKSKEIPGEWVFNGKQCAGYVDTKLEFSKELEGGGGGREIT